MDKLESPTAALIVGSSSCGKSTLLRQLIRSHRMVLEKPLEYVVWAKNPHTGDEAELDKLKEDLAAQGVNMKVVMGFPEKQLESGSLFDDAPKTAHKALVLDDLQLFAMKSAVILELFQVMRHHLNISIFFVTQALMVGGPKSKYGASVLIQNARYLVIFPDRRQLSTIKIVSLRYFPGIREVAEMPFMECMSDTHGYLLYDLQSPDISNQIFQNPFTAAGFVFTFSSKQEHKAGDKPAK